MMRTKIKIVSNLGGLKDWLERVYAKLDRCPSARGIRNVVPLIVGCVLVKVVRVRVHTYRGKMGNVCWAWINGRRYCFTRLPRDLARRRPDGVRAVLVRERTRDGNVLAAFTNATPAGEVRKFFASL
jgi:hypothetical protein